jgi:hypothetical protein
MCGLNMLSVRHLGKGNTMRTVSFVLLLIAGLALMATGCSDNSASVTSPGDQTLSRTAELPATILGKSGPLLNSVSGNMHNFIKFSNGKAGKKWDFFGDVSMSAKLDQDNTASGNIRVHYIGERPPESWPAFSAKISQLKVENNPGVGVMAKLMFVVTEGAEIMEMYGPTPVGCMVVIDGGEGKKALPDCTVKIVCIDSPEVMAFYGFYEMSPLQYFQLMELWFGPPQYLPIDNGNIQVR